MQWWGARQDLASTGTSAAARATHCRHCSPTSRMARVVPAAASKDAGSRAAAWAQAAAAHPVRRVAGVVVQHELEVVQPHQEAALILLRRAAGGAVMGSPGVPAAPSARPATAEGPAPPLPRRPWRTACASSRTTPWAKPAARGAGREVRQSPGGGPAGVPAASRHPASLPRIDGAHHGLLDEETVVQ